MNNMFKYISVFLAGVIAAFMLMFEKLKPVYNTEQNIGKLKQKGEGNEQNTKGEITIPGNGKGEAVQDKKAIRKKRREERKNNHLK